MSSASSVVERYLRWRVLLVPQGVDWIQHRGLRRRIESEENPDPGREAEREENRVHRDVGRPGEHVRDGARAGNSRQRADAAADQAENQRLDQELKTHIAP